MNPLFTDNILDMRPQAVQFYKAFCLCLRRVDSIARPVRTEGGQFGPKEVLEPPSGPWSFLLILANLSTVRDIQITYLFHEYIKSQTSTSNIGNTTFKN